MLKNYILILTLIFPFTIKAVETKLFADGSRFYLTIVNNSQSSIDLAESLVLGHCDHDANICLKVVDQQKKELSILARPMNFNPDYPNRIVIHPSNLYGVKSNKNEVIRRFGLINGCYDVSLIYKDRKHKITVESEPVKLAVKDRKAIIDARCQTAQ